MGRRAGRGSVKAPWVEVKQKNSGKLRWRRGGFPMKGRYRLLALKCGHEVVRQCRPTGLVRVRCQQCRRASFGKKRPHLLLG